MIRKIGYTAKIHKLNELVTKNWMSADILKSSEVDPQTGNNYEYD